MFKKLLLVIVGLIASIGMAIAAVNINTATEQELDSLPGVGPVKAKAIVEYRKANGNFKALDDIKKVNGIGDKTFDDLKGQIAISGATTVAAAPAKAADKKDSKPAAKEVKVEAKPAAPAPEVKVEKAKSAAKDAAKEVKAEAKPVAAAADAKADKAKEKADKKAEAKAKKEAEAAAKAAK